MIIEIKYKDKQNWNTISGDVINWQNYSRKYKDERIQPYYVAPEEITNSWNGREHDVQHIRWDCYYFEMFIKESEIHDISRLRSCSEIIIIEYNKDSTGTIKAKEYEIDTTKLANFQLSEPERIGQTTAWKFSVIFRTNKTIINKCTPVLNTNELSISSGNWSKISQYSFKSGVNKSVALNETRLAVYESGYLYNYELSSGNWGQVGNSLNIGLLTNISLCKLDETNIAFTANGILSKYGWSGADWELFGTSYTFTTSKTDPCITALDLNTIVIADSGQKKIETYAFDGNVWSLSGNALQLSITGTPNIFISSNSGSDIAYFDNITKELRNYSWDSTDWSLEHFTTSTLDDVFLTSLDVDNIAILDNDNKTLTRYFNNGSGYELFGNVQSLTSYNYISISKVTDSEVILFNTDSYNEWIKSIETGIVPVLNQASLAVLTSTRIALIGYGGGSEEGILYAYDLIDNNWTQAGTSYPIPGSFNNISICYLDTDKITLRQSDENWLSTYQFNGTVWSLVGNHFTLNSDNPVIDYLTANTIVSYDSTYDYLQVFSFDGSDWSQVGNDFSLILPGSAITDLAALSSSQVIFFDSYTKKMRLYDWDGSDFTLNFEQIMPVGNNVKICKYDSTSIIVLDQDNSILRKYNIVGSAFTQDTAYLSTLPYSVWGSIELLSSRLFVSLKITGKYLTVFNYSQIYTNYTQNYSNDTNRFYTDFDCIESFIEVEPIKVDWFDGAQKIIQQTQKNTLELLFYFTSSERINFLTKIKELNIIMINDISVSDYTIETGQIADDYYYVIVKGITDVIVNSYDVSPDNTYNLRIVNNSVTYNFYTDYKPELVSEEPEISSFQNNDGINYTSKAISFTVKKLTFFEDETTAFEIKKRFELGGTITLDGTTVYENKSVVPESIGIDLYRVEVVCKMSADISY